MTNFEQKYAKLTKESEEETSQTSSTRASARSTGLDSRQFERLRLDEAKIHLADVDDSVDSDDDDRW